MHARVRVRLCMCNRVTDLQSPQAFHPAVSGEGPPRGVAPPPPPGDGSLLGFPPQLQGIPVPGKIMLKYNIFHH